MNNPSRIPTSLRTLRLLEVIGLSDQPMSPTEANAKLGLPKQTIHRLCDRLVAQQYLVRGGGGKKLSPGKRLQAMASGVLFASHHHIARHQILMDAARQIGETINYVVPEEKGMMYLDRVETDWPLRIQLPVGTHVPFHCTASGKAFLSSLPRRTQKSIVTSLILDSLTANTICTADALLKELKSAASNGYSLDREEFIEGMIAAAVPICNHKGNFLAALAFHGPTQRLSLEEVIGKKDILLEAAARLRDTLFA